MPADARPRAGLVELALALVLVAAGCGGGDSRSNTIKIAFVTDCASTFSGGGSSFMAGAELPFLRRGSRLRGSEPSQGVTDAIVAGKHVQLLLDCETYGEFTTLAEAVRRAVEDDHADIVVEPNAVDEGLVVKQYARSHPEITFSMASGEQSTTLKSPLPNVFRFTVDAAQAQAGLGAYAYRTRGWRNVVTISEDDPYGWDEEAGFAAEFCSLGGHIVKRIWPSGFQPDFAREVKKIPAKGVDGVVFPSDDFDLRSFMAALAKRYRRFRNRLLVNADPSNLAAGQGLSEAFRGSLKNRMLGIVGVSPWPLAGTPRSRRYAARAAAAFPGVGTDFYSYDAMEPVLQALKRVHGDLSRREQRFQHALARLTFQAPNGRTTLDGRHQAVAPTYLGRVGKDWHGQLLMRQIAVVPKVEQTYGGYFSSASPPPGRHPVCKRRTPPPWVNSVPATR